jgi:hypothetical protein
MGTEFRPLRDATINSALLNLRAQIIREDGPGLRHVEALLKLRGVPLPPVPYRALYRHFRRNALRRAIRAELRSGPLAAREVAGRIAKRDGLEDCHRTVRRALTVMKAKGQVRNGGGVWWLPN